MSRTSLPCVHFYFWKKHIEQWVFIQYRITPPKGGVLWIINF